MYKSADMIFGTGVSFAGGKGKAYSLLSCAYDFGIRKYDTAPSYKTEALLGDVLLKMKAEKNIGREEYYLQSKIDARQMQDGKIYEHVDSSLNKLKTDYLDALLIHWPVPEYMASTWKKMCGLKSKGIVRKIGICNVRARQLKKYVSWNPDIVQIERHPLNVFQEEVDICHSNNITVQAYSPLCKMDSRIKESSIIKSIAAKYRKDVGQIVLKWHLECDVMPIFTSTKTERITLYAQLNDFNLTVDEIRAVNSMNENYKMYLESAACPGF